MKKYIPYIFICVFSLIFISRFMMFVATQDVGIEHDSGWYLSVARNLAEKGIYASSINTIENSDKRGAFPSIHGRFSVQDEKGYSYFPAGVTVGPGFIIPEAIILKLFGSGWIQFRIFPLFCFSLLIVLLFTLVYRFGGIIGFALFGIWVWFYPQIWINQSFEAFSEQIALLYLLVGLVFISQKKPSLRSIIFGGLFIGLSIQTKSLFFLSFPMIVGLDLILRKKLHSTLLLTAFILTPTILFEAYRFMYLSINFGLAGYNAINQDIALTMNAGGSGLATLRSGIDMNFVLKKIRVWEHVGISTALFGIPLVLSGFLQKPLPRLVLYMIACFLSFFTWYALLSQTGWFRHALPAVIISMVFISIIYSLLLQRFIFKKQYIFLIVSMIVYILTIHSIVFNLLSYTPFALTKTMLWEKHWNRVNDLQGPFFVPVFSKYDEEGVKNYISTSIPKRAKLCYEGWFLVAELPSIINRPIFPLARCIKNDILVIGPYQRGPYNLLNDGNKRIDSLIEARCKTTPFKNTSYLLCVLK